MKGISDLPVTLEQLSERVEALEQRVRDLERGSTAPQSTAALSSAAETVPDSLPESSPGEHLTGTFLLLGKSMLGIAGAYLLRALAESGVLPVLLIAVVAIAYAIIWLVAASRASTQSRFASLLYASTSALILAPMLWELTMRFHALSPGASAAVLGMFAGGSTALGWKRDRVPDFGVAYSAAAITALALSIATHVSIPFLILLLAMLALCEYRFVRGRMEALRMLIAVSADCAVWFLIVIYRAPAAERTDYPALGFVALAAPATFLLTISAGAVAFKTAFLKRRISIFETGQCVVAFFLWILSGIFLLPGVSARVVGVICLVFAAGCYGAAYGLFRHSAELRNFHVFALWSVALSLAGILLSLPGGWPVACLALGAVVCAIIAVRIGCATLEFHGLVYLLAAALACGLVEYSFKTLAGSVPATFHWSEYLVAACAIVCYFAARELEGERWQMQLLHLSPALLAAVALAALMAYGSIRIMSGRIVVEVFHVAFIRTLTLCVLALALAFAGSRWRRLELKRIAYAALALLTAKLLFEDLRHGHTGFIAASIFLYALTLIAIPRMTHVAGRS